MKKPELKQLDNSLKKETLVEVGVFCKRDNSGKFYDSQPILQEVSIEEEIKFKKLIVDEFADLLLDFMNKKQLING